MDNDVIDVGGTSEHLKGEDMETRVRRLEEEMVTLKGDASLRNLPYGTLKQAASMLSLRTVGGVGGCYPAGCLPLDVATASDTYAADVLFAFPFYMPGVPNVIVEIGIRVMTGAAGNIRLGIYADSGEPLLHPHKLLLDAGAVDVGSTGVKSITIKKELPRGLVWLAYVASATHYILAVTDTYWTPLGWHDDAISKYMGLRINFGYAALPDPFPAGFAGAAAGPMPYIYLKFG